MNDEPDLLFGPGVARSGFTPAGIAAFSDLRPAAVVRELIQNSLDAALGEAGERCAKVRFHQFQVPVQAIPGIESYRKAFNLAVDTAIQAGGGRMPTQAESVVDRIRNALEDSFPHVLSITDNGIGLNDGRMSALLSDGVSAKSSDAAGTFGNGHSVVIPASNLRYVLYGGLVAEGRKIGAGQAVIASHNVSGEQHPRSSHGFYIKDFRIASDGSAHEYASGSSVPPLIDHEIEWIREHHGHGAAVIIPFFNNFQDERNLWAMVSRAAACNFFQAIHEGRLVVEVEDQTAIPDDEMSEPKLRVLDSTTLVQTLEEYKAEKRLRNGAFLTGERANEAYETLLKGERFSIPTTLGEVSLCLQQDAGSNQVFLIRNRMWITESIPGLQKSSFSDRQPFRAILLLEPGNQNDFYSLIQRSETPLHNELAIKQLSPPEDKKKLRAALREVRMRIHDLVPELKSDSFSIPDVLDVQFEGIRKGGSGNRHPSFWGTPVARRRGVPSSGPDIGEVELPGGFASGVAVNHPEQRDTHVIYPSLFQIASAPAGPGRQRVHVVSKRGCRNARLRIFVDENVDDTCDRQSRGEAALAQLSDVLINGQRAPDALIQDGHAISLGDLSEGEELLIEAGYSVPHEVLMLPGHNPTLRVEVVRVQERSSKKILRHSVGKESDD